MRRDPRVFANKTSDIVDDIHGTTLDENWKLVESVDNENKTIKVKESIHDRNIHFPINIPNLPVLLPMSSDSKLYFNQQGFTVFLGNEFVDVVNGYKYPVEQIPLTGNKRFKHNSTLALSLNEQNKINVFNLREEWSDLDDYRFNGVLRFSLLEYSPYSGLKEYPNIKKEYGTEKRYQGYGLRFHYDDSFYKNLKHILYFVPVTEGSSVSFTKSGFVTITGDVGMLDFDTKLLASNNEGKVLTWDISQNASKTLYHRFFRKTGSVDIAVSKTPSDAILNAFGRAYDPNTFLNLFFNVQVNENAKWNEPCLTLTYKAGLVEELFSSGFYLDELHLTPVKEGSKVIVDVENKTIRIVGEVLNRYFYKLKEGTFSFNQFKDGGINEEVSTTEYARLNCFKYNYTQPQRHLHYSLLLGNIIKKPNSEVFEILPYTWDRNIWNSVRYENRGSIIPPTKSSDVWSIWSNGNIPSSADDFKDNRLYELAGTTEFCTKYNEYVYPQILRNDYCRFPYIRATNSYHRQVQFDWRPFYKHAIEMDDLIEENKKLFKAKHCDTAMPISNRIVNNLLNTENIPVVPMHSDARDIFNDSTLNFYRLDQVPIELRKQYPFTYFFNSTGDDKHAKYLATCKRVPSDGFDLSLFNGSTDIWMFTPSVVHIPYSRVLPKEQRGTHGPWEESDVAILHPVYVTEDKTNYYPYRYNLNTRVFEKVNGSDPDVSVDAHLLDVDYFDWFYRFEKEYNIGGKHNSMELFNYYSRYLKPTNGVNVMTLFYIHGEYINGSAGEPTIDIDKYGSLTETPILNNFHVRMGEENWIVYRPSSAPIGAKYWSTERKIAEFFSASGIGDYITDTAWLSYKGTYSGFVYRKMEQFRSPDIFCLMYKITPDGKIIDESPRDHRPYIHWTGNKETSCLIYPGGKYLYPYNLYSTLPEEPTNYDEYVKLNTGYVFDYDPNSWYYKQDRYVCVVLNSKGEIIKDRATVADIEANKPYAKLPVLAFQPSRVDKGTDVQTQFTSPNEMMMYVINKYVGLGNRYFDAAGYYERNRIHHKDHYLYTNYDVNLITPAETDSYIDLRYNGNVIEHRGSRNGGEIYELVPMRNARDVHIMFNTLPYQPVETLNSKSITGTPTMMFDTSEYTMKTTGEWLVDGSKMLISSNKALAFVDLSGPSYFSQFTKIDSESRKYNANKLIRNSNLTPRGNLVDYEETKRNISLSKNNVHVLLNLVVGVNRTEARV